MTPSDDAAPRSTAEASPSGANSGARQTPQLLPLSLGLVAAARKLSSTHGTRFDRAYYTEKAFKGLWDRVWQRDNYTCRFCGFRSRDHQEVHPLDNDHSSKGQTLENLVTTCSLCHQCYHLDTVSTSSGGKIVLMPEFSQIELNHLARSLFVAQDTIERMTKEAEGGDIDQGYMRQTRVLEDLILERARALEQHLGQGSSDPAFFGMALLSLSPEDYSTRERFIRDIRLMPSRARFVVQTRYHALKAWDQLPMASWISIAPGDAAGLATTHD